MKIGIFDSGFGGLNVFKYISSSLEKYDLVYLGDTAKAPYGDRSQETIYEYVKEGVEFLFSKDCNLVVLACNTASAEALRKIQQEFLPNNYPDRNVLGVLIPVSEEVILTTKNKRIGVLATQSTIESGAYVREIQKIDPEIEVFGQAAPLLVPIVESGETNYSIIDSAIRGYLSPLILKSVDTVILGCTHYGILKDRVLGVIDSSGKDIKVISGEEIIAEKLKKYIERHTEFETKLSRNGSREFYTTDTGDRFDIFGSKILGEEVKSVKVSIEK